MKQFYNFFFSYILLKILKPFQTKEPRPTFLRKLHYNRGEKVIVIWVNRTIIRMIMKTMKHMLLKTKLSID